jgi:hypothetical protein
MAVTYAPPRRDKALREQGLVGITKITALDFTNTAQNRKVDLL